MDTFTYLGILYSSQQDWIQADENLGEAIKIGRKVRDVFRLAKALIVQGNCYLNQGQYEAAIPYYQEAVQLAGDHQYRHRQMRALWKLSQCYDKMGRQEEFIHCMKELYLLQHELNYKDKEDDFYEV